jgi:nuclear RNA export factor
LLASPQWPATIANEQLHIGGDGITARPAAAPALTPVAAAAAASAPSLIASPQQAAGPDQQQLTLQFMAITGMNQQFATECLQNNNWNPEQSMADFQRLNAAGQLPPQAFQ